MRLKYFAIGSLRLGATALIVLSMSVTSYALESSSIQVTKNTYFCSRGSLKNFRFNAVSMNDAINKSEKFFSRRCKARGKYKTSMSCSELRNYNTICQSGYLCTKGSFSAISKALSRSQAIIDSNKLFFKRCGARRGKKYSMACDELKNYHTTCE